MRTALILGIILTFVPAGLCAGEGTAVVGVRDGSLYAENVRITDGEQSVKALADGPIAGIGSVAAKEGAASALTVKLDHPVGEKGTLSFWLHPNRFFRNGPDKQKLTYELLRIPLIGKVYFWETAEACMMAWDWDWDVVKGADWIGTLFPELPGPEWYHLVYTWDCTQGRFDAYINGTAQRSLAARRDPWKLGEGSQIIIQPGDFSFADVTIRHEYLMQQQVLDLLPAQYRNKRSEILGVRNDVEPIETTDRRGALLYDSSMACREDIKDWVMEGPGVVSFVDGWMQMESELEDGVRKGHIVHWCPQNFPESFIAEMDIRQISNQGLGIIFFAAAAENGTDIFDPSLPARDGTFRQYTSDAIVSYHISYYADTRGMSNLRKNNKFYLVSNGPPGIPANDLDPHKMRLIKDGAHIQLQFDDRIIIDFIDDGKHYGQILGGGKIGLRQMKPMVGQYRNLRVWGLTPALRPPTPPPYPE